MWSLFELAIGYLNGITVHLDCLLFNLFVLVPCQESVDSMLHHLSLSNQLVLLKVTWRIASMHSDTICIYATCQLESFTWLIIHKHSKESWLLLYLTRKFLFMFISWYRWSVNPVRPGLTKDNLLVHLRLKSLLESGLIEQYIDKYWLKWWPNQLQTWFQNDRNSYMI